MSCLPGRMWGEGCVSYKRFHVLWTMESFQDLTFQRPKGLGNVKWRLMKVIKFQTPDIF